MNKLPQLLIIVILAISASCKHHTPYTHVNGFAEGTTYSITYEGADTLRHEIEAALARFDSSLSIYNSASIISKVNRNEDVALDSLFIGCFNLAQQITKQTNGAFDMSAAPLFGAWGFGSQKTHKTPSSKQIDSLKAFCGMDKIRIENNRVVKTDPRTTINANAIAKGYSVDIIANLLEGKGKKNYLVEIGGEIFCRGVNPKGSAWVIGIDRPTDSNFVPGENLQAKIKLSGKGLATSGNYRKFYVQDGKKVAHTINPKTGYPAYANILSASVVAPTCGTADAFATAFMVVGLDSAKSILEQYPDLEAFLIYTSDSGEYQSYTTPKLSKMIVK